MMCSRNAALVVDRDNYGTPHTSIVAGMNDTEFHDQSTEFCMWVAVPVGNVENQ
jgi:hypothetical protein